MVYFVGVIDIILV